MMKKLLAAILILSVSLSLASCNKDPQPVSSSEPASSGAAGSSSAFVEAKLYTFEEAAAINAGIKDSDVNLIQFEKPKSSSPTATIKTSAGDISLVLYPEQAPKAVENFITQAKDGYYNGMDFYKAVHDFIIQSGAPSGKEPTSIYKDDEGNPVAFESEFSLDLWSFRGALVMVNKGATRPNTNTSEFMIVQADFVNNETVDAMKEAKFPEKVIEKYQEVGGVPGFDWHNTVFGMVTEGMDIVDEIASVDVDETYRPLKPIIIESITVQE